MTIRAKFNSTCPECSGRIVAGEQVEWVPGGKATHPACASKPASSGTVANHDRMEDWSNVKAAPNAPAKQRLTNPSPYQQAIFDWIQHGTGSAVVDAVAGSGKTSTIVEACYYLPEGTKAKFVAFNANIASELGERLPDGIPASTFHSACYQALKSSVMPHLRGRKVDTAKLRNTARRLINQGLITEEEAQQYLGPAMQLVGKAKNAGVGLLIEDEDQTWQDLVDRFDIAFSDGGR